MLRVCYMLDVSGDAKSVEDWRCPSSRPYYSTHGTDVVTSEKRRISSRNHDNRDPLVGETGPLAASSPGAAVDRLAVTDAVATTDDQGVAVVAALPYVVATIAIVLILLIVVGAVSYIAAARS